MQMIVVMASVIALASEDGQETCCEPYFSIKTCWGHDCDHMMHLGVSSFCQAHELVLSRECSDRDDS